METRMPAPAHSAAHAFPVSVKGVAVQGGRVLLLENERNEWELPGGKLELREDPADCVVREIREEAGWKVTAGPFLDAHPACRWVVGFRSLVGAACQDDPGGRLSSSTRRWVCDRYVGVDESLLVAGFSWVVRVATRPETSWSAPRGRAIPPWSRPSGLRCTTRQVPAEQDHHEDDLGYLQI